MNPISSSLMVTKKAPVKLRGSENKTKGHEHGERVMKGGGEESVEVSAINMHYTHMKLSKNKFN